MTKIVMKFGGSVITNKSAKEPKISIEILDDPGKYLKLNAMKKIAGSIHSAMQDNSDLELVLITGAGCCGHPQVKAGLPPREIHKVACIPAFYLQKALLEQKVQSNLVSPYVCVTCLDSDGTHGLAYDIDKLWQAMRNPDSDVLKITRYAKMSHGDVVPMATGKTGRLTNYEVISGDNLVVDIGAMWPANQVIMVSDIDGVYTDDPKANNQAKKVDKIIVGEKIDDDKSFKAKMERDYNVLFADVQDVTKGFFGKVGKLCNFTYETNIKSQIIGIEGIEAALKGKDAGTVFVKT